MKPADMTKNNKKMLPVINNGSGSSKKVVRNPYKEISHGCGCGAISCENCPGAFKIKVESDRNVNYRSVFSYLKIVTVILVATCIVREALTLRLI